MGAALPRFDNPADPYPVGTATAQWTDSARPESAAEPADRRVVVAQAWYPATSSAADGRAWYLGRTQDEAAAVAHGLADTFGVARAGHLTFTDAPL